MSFRTVCALKDTGGKHRLEVTIGPSRTILPPPPHIDVMKAKLPSEWATGQYSFRGQFSVKGRRRGTLNKFEDYRYLLLPIYQRLEFQTF